MIIMQFHHINIDVLEISDKNFQVIDIDKPIIPTPQYIAYKSNFYKLPKEIIINIDQISLNTISKELINTILCFKHNFTIVYSELNHVKSGKAIDLTQKFGAIIKEKKLTQEQSDQMYILSISNKKIEISALTIQGLLYGMNSVSQIIHINQNSWVVQQMDIIDYPTVSKRISSIPKIRNNYFSDEFWINLLFRYKINYLFLHNSDSHPLKSTPVHTPSFSEIESLAKPFNIKIINNATIHNFDHIINTNQINPNYPYKDMIRFIEKTWNSEKNVSNNIQECFIFDIFGMYNPHLLWKFILSFLSLNEEISSFLIHNQDSFIIKSKSIFIKYHLYRKKKKRNTILKKIENLEEMYFYITNSVIRNMNIIENFLRSLKEMKLLLN